MWREGIRSLAPISPEDRSDNNADIFKTIQKDSSQMDFKNVTIEQERYKFTITGNVAGSNRHVEVIYEPYFEIFLRQDWRIVGRCGIDVEAEYIEDQEITEHLEELDALKLHQFLSRVSEIANRINSQNN